MKISSLSSILLLIAPLVFADSNAEVIEFQAILSDVNNHLNDYISYAVNEPSFTLPSGVLEVYTQMTTYTDDSYTTLFSEIDFGSINAVMTALPWYSSRLEPEIQSAFKANSVTGTSLGIQVTQSSSTSSSTSSVSTAPTSSGSSSAASKKSESTSASLSSSTSFSSSSSSAKSSSSSSSSSASSSSSSTSASASSATTSSHSAAANQNQLNTILGAAFLGSVAMFL